MRKFEIFTQISVKCLFKYLNIIVLILLSFHAFHSNAQCSLICRPSLNISLGYDVLRLSPADLLSTVPTTCAPNLIVEIIDQYGVVRGDTVFCDYVGKTMTTRVRDIVNNNSCTGSIIVFDGSSPKIHCVDTFISCNNPYQPGAVKVPVYYDNCTPTNLITKQYNDNFIDYDCFTSINNKIVTAKVIRKWTVTDQSGNSNSCIQNIYLERNTIQQIIFPPNRDGFSAPYLICNQDDPNDLILTGYPTINGIPYNNAGSCELSITFTDNTINNCGASKTVLREWRASDWCNGDFLIKTQIIKVQDNIAPMITCPTDRTISTDQNSCSATVVLPLASGTDNCSSFTFMTTSNFGNGYNLYNVPIGNHVITYKAIDACNNQSTCNMQLSIVDKIIPVAICQSSLNVTLSNQGQGKVYAKALDNSSHDNCQIQSYKASRDSVNYIDTLSFNCGDINISPIRVYLKVKDIFGNENICTANIKVKDINKPSIFCPKDTVVSCTEDFTFPNRFGTPSYTDNCSIKSISKSDSTSLNICKIGFLFRKWIVEDSSGNTNQCIQKIKIQDTTDFVVVFPLNFKTYQCFQIVDTAISGAPTYIGNDCEYIDVKFEDNYINNNYPSCYKILRKWTVINWCNYNQSNNVGYYQYNQVIDIIDTIGPKLYCPKDTIIKILKDCEAIVKLKDVTASDCSSLITITNNSPFANQNFENATGIYPLGNHNVSFYAEDNCGNQSICFVKINVIDTIKPKALCNSYQFLQLDTSLTATVTPLFLNKNSFDNCTDSAHLSFNLNKTNFDCTNLGLNIVKLYVKDKSGNIDSCSGFINIYNNRRDCPNSYEGIISGGIYDELGSPIANVSIYNSDIIGTTTNTNGTYALSGLPILENFNIKPELNNGVLNGITTLDINLIRKHILDVNKLNSPYKLIAADVNKSGSITSLDLLQIRQLILRLTTSFPNNKSWRFLDATQVFTDFNNPFQDVFKEQIYIGNLNTTANNKNFIGIKVGDVNNSADNIANIRSSQELFYEPIHLSNSQLCIPFYFKKNKDLLGYQLQIDFDDNDIKPIAIHSKLPNFQTSNYIINKNNIIISYDNVSTITTDTLFEVIATNLNNSKIVNLDLSNDFVNFMFENNTQSLISLHQNENENYKIKFYPNPFQDQLFMEIKSYFADNINIKFLNLEGKLLKEIDQKIPKGNSIFPLLDSELSSSSNIIFVKIVGQYINYTTFLTKFN